MSQVQTKCKHPTIYKLNPPTHIAKQYGETVECGRCRTCKAGFMKNFHGKWKEITNLP